MGTEIERKFLLRNDDWRGGAGRLMRQGYLSAGSGVTVRVRIADTEAWLTVKGPSQDAAAASPGRPAPGRAAPGRAAPGRAAPGRAAPGRAAPGRAEYEYLIPLADAEEMLSQLCAQPLIEKRRYEVEYRGLTWEVDEFLGDNAGLLVAEVELESADQSVPLPPWIGEEVTGDPRYYNASLVHRPYSQW